MKQNDITTLSKVSLYRYENFFNVYKDSNNFYFYNLLRNISLFPASNSDVEIVYNTTFNDTWVLISYKHYNTMELWWLVCAYNQIDNPVKMPKSGTQLKILNPSYVGTVISELNKQITR